MHLYQLNRIYLIKHHQLKNFYADIQDALVKQRPTLRIKKIIAEKFH